MTVSGVSYGVVKESGSHRLAQSVLISCSFCEIFYGRFGKETPSSFNPSFSHSQYKCIYGVVTRIFGIRN